MTQQTFVHGGESRASLVLKIVSQGTLDRLLIRIHEEQPRSPADLIGDEEGFSKANLYKLLDKARDKGLIEAGALVLTIVGERRAKELGAIDPAELDFAEEPTE